jgi:hypothetical protein
MSWIYRRRYTLLIGADRKNQKREKSAFSFICTKFKSNHFEFFLGVFFGSRCMD